MEVVFWFLMVCRTSGRGSNVRGIDGLFPLIPLREGRGRSAAGDGQTQGEALAKKVSQQLGLKGSNPEGTTE